MTDPKRGVPGPDHQGKQSRQRWEVRALVPFLGSVSTLSMTQARPWPALSPRFLSCHMEGHDKVSSKGL